MRKWMAFCCLGWAALLSSGLPGQAQVEQPEPAPTNASQTLDRRLTVEGVGRLPLQSSEAAQQQAYQAAILDAYQQLLWQGAEQMGLLSENQSLEIRSLRLDEHHPNPILLDWLLRSEAVSQQEVSGRLRVAVQSPPLSELSKDSGPHFVRSQAVDVDGDGKPDNLGVTYDGRILVTKSNGQLLASSPCLNLLACSSMRLSGGDSWDLVQLTRVLNLSNVEVVSRDKLRVVAEVSLGESVDEFWVGKASEQREVLLHAADPKNEPIIELTEPRDFLATTKDKVAWKGVLQTPAGLSSAKLRVNGRPFWQTPEGLTSRRLRMDIVLSLLPGTNRAQVSLSDQSQRNLTREVLLYRQAGCPSSVPARRRALLIGVSEYAAMQFPKLAGVSHDLVRLQQFLERKDGGDIPHENITVLKGKDATRARILESLQQLGKVEGEERVLCLIYFAGLSSPSSGSGSKGLLPYDARGLDQGSLSARDLTTALGELRQQDVFFLSDTSQASFNSESGDPAWLDAQDFSESLSRQGWATISSVDASTDVRDTSQGSRLLSAFLEGCGSPADANRDGWIELEEIYRQMFQSLKVSSPGTPSPLRRGELLGRVPLARCR